MNNLVYKKAFKRKSMPTILIAAFITLLYFAIDLSGLEQKALVHIFNHVKTPVSDKLVIIEIDDESIQHFNYWPWPRARFAELLNKLEEAQPEIVAFDIDFSAKSDSYNDHILSLAISNAPFPVILPTIIIDTDLYLLNNHTNSPKQDHIENKPIEQLAKFSLLANANAVISDNGEVVKYATFAPNGRATIGALLANKANTKKQPLHINLSINPNDILKISFKDIILGNYDRDSLKGKKILVGTTSTEKGDTYSVSKYGRLSGVTIHALGFETIVSEFQFVQIEPVFILLLSLILFFLLAVSHDDKKLLVTLIINLNVIGLVYLCTVVVHHWLFFMLPSTALYIAVAANTVLQIVQNINYRTNMMYKETNRNNYNKALINQVIKESANGIVITDLSGGILVANRKARQLFSINHQTLRGKESVFEYIEGSESLFEKTKDLSIYEISRIGFVEQKIINKHGQEFAIELMLNKTNFVQFTGIKRKKISHQIYNFTINDITEKVKIIADKREVDIAIVDLKNNDPLTKLPNRNSMIKHLKTIYANEDGVNQCMLMLINLDSLKEINETNGENFGDDVICYMARRFKQQIDIDGDVFRYSDKTFAIIINKRNEEKYINFIRMIHDTSTKPLMIFDTAVQMSLSIGVAIGPHHGKTPEILINNATQALDYTKTSKTYKWFIYEENLAKNLRQKRDIRNELIRAIKHEEFVLYYQPQHDIRSGKLIGYESLIRWNDPIKGLRFPDEFIPVAEEFGLITAIGELVLKIGCNDAAPWPDHLSVAINVSPIQFKQVDMVMLCKKYLKESGLQAHRLELEITESMLMDDITDVIKTLTEIQVLGIKIAMDDFGTGYSSLQYLTELPFDKIKIDRSFTKNIGKSKQADALISTIVALGHSLDKLVLAEGIESEDMIFLLKAAGCQIGQGYHYGKPVPIGVVNEHHKLLNTLSNTG